MPASKTLPLWGGRTLALLGILLVALNLRTAVSSLSPVASQISADIPMGPIGLALLGMVPPIAFSVSGLFSAAGVRRFGLEVFLIFAIVAMGLGAIIRGIAGDYASLMLGTVIALGGAGIGNVLLPPLVKRYFPDRIGLLTAMYATVLSVGMMVPPGVAVPIADSAGWRVSLGMWAVAAVAALLPWIMLVLQRRKVSTQNGGVPDLVQATQALGGNIWRSKLAWLLTALFAIAAFEAYVVLALMPQMLVDVAGTSVLEAGTLLSLFALLGLPASMVIPGLAVRIAKPERIVYFGAFCYAGGFLGLLLAPTFSPALWVILIGPGQSIATMMLVLFNLRSRTQEGAIALSSFVQGIGYALAALGPLFVGLLRDVTGEWKWSMIIMVVVGLCGFLVGYLLRKPLFIEDDLAR